MRKFLLLMMVLGIGAVGQNARADESCGTKSGLCWPNLERGAKGPRVVALQYLLLARGYKLRADGALGYATESALRKFQVKNKLQVDGKVGWQSWEALTPNLKAGASGNAVRALQTLLSQSGYKVKIDGAFGSATQKAILHFTSPEAELVKPTDVANKSVWCWLTGGRNMSD